MSFYKDEWYLRDPCVKVFEVSCTPSAHDPNEAVSLSYLVLEALLLSAQLSCVDGISKISFGDILDNRSLQHIGIAAFIDVKLDETNLDVSCLMIEKYGETNAAGLVLTPEAVGTR